MSLFEFNKTDQILLLGEGNFSFSCSLVKLMREKYGQLNFSNVFATCFQTVLSSSSLANVEYLKTQGAEILFGVDATKLQQEERFKCIKFKKIIFNFPHIGGKMKIHLNRELLCNFFISCSNIIAEDGIVVVTLCYGQGGTGFEVTTRRWDDTWQIVEQAAHGSFVLFQTEFFPDKLFKDYKPIGFRGREQEFSIASSVIHGFHKVSLPMSCLTTNLINDLVSYHNLGMKGDLKVSFAHKESILRNPLTNPNSPQYFLVNLLNECLKAHEQEIELDISMPYHLNYSFEKASCYFEGSLCSLRSCLLEVVPRKQSTFLVAGLVFHKFTLEFNKYPATCQVVVNGPFSRSATEDFIANIVQLFNFDGKITVDDKESFWAIYFESDKIANMKDIIAFSDCKMRVLIKVDLLCLFLFKISLKELWAKGVSFNEAKYCLQLPSLYPQKFIFDISFACQNILNEEEFLFILHQCPDNLIDSVNLLSVYAHPTRHDKSYCYRITYRSFEKPLYRKLVIEIQKNIIGKLLESFLNVRIN